MPSIKKHQEKRELVEKLIEEGLTKKQISEQSEIPLGSIDHYLRMWGLKTKRFRANKDRGALSIYRQQVDQVIASTGVSEQDAANLVVSLNLGRGKYDHLYYKAKELVYQGKPTYDIAKELGIPTGSIAYTLERWGLHGEAEKARGGRFTQEGMGSIKEGVRQVHKRGREHHFKGMATLRGQWVTPEEQLQAVKECVEKDMTYAEMVDELQVTHGTLLKCLRQLKALRGARKGERDPKWKGGHRKYRGPDWYTNRKLARKRDGYKCVDCGKTEEQEKIDSKRNRGLSVHHKNPYEESFDSTLENLVTLCQSCHMKREHKEGRHKK